MTLTSEEAHDTIESLNQTAYDYTYQQWVEADDNEELREEASEAQQKVFRELFNNLNKDTQDKIMHFVETDKNFAEDFYCWYGEE